MDQDTLLIKNFSGDFNDYGIGHEIINFFDNNNKLNYIPFYVPPYGYVGEENDKFIYNDIYKNIKKIVSFDSTPFTNIYKLHSVVLNPVKFSSIKEIQDLTNSLTYGPKNTTLSNIDFKDIHKNISLVTYKVLKDNYYDLRKNNIYLYIPRNKDDNNRIKSNSINNFKKYFTNINIETLDTTKVGQNNYSYNLGDDFNTWYTTVVQPLVIKNNKYKLECVNENKLPYKYESDNFVEISEKYNDENLYTNYICNILNKYNLNELFIEYLVKLIYANNTYKSNKCNIIKQVNINTYLKDNNINKKINPNGVLDIFVSDDNYNIVIENKINSDLNGKYKEKGQALNQLDTYNKFINILDKNKQYKIVLLIPERYKVYFINKNLNDVYIMSYKELLKFFIDNSNVIDIKYRDDLINCLCKNSLTREEDIINRFYNTLNKEVIL